ncbi:unnamed protein product [Rotaria magnacalcarata]|uniref:Uncharacterized protein n=1 Tax=Rotaria magnacalcarata TaxID=392030 RepID=A0A820AW75_9BILA|nr:unnamed protein product [Rotaria magnacalcarata]CAF1648312.1 unnamed protein product [Rotaria magnacalcarata]CAF1934778.1 unnamed protein product [Rotaria magnacalcarata]CAF2060678.1 unnamed protein product [Rotaria magnacalcarata]CAF2117325.1 unnamed protein product [Rotaria magnacalcarata]
MGCCPNKSSTVMTPSVVNNPLNNEEPSIPAASCSPSSHPNRLIELKDEDIMMRLVTQHTIETNIRMNSLQFDHHEFHRRPNARTMALVTPQILSEVENELVKDLSNGLSFIVINCRATSSFNAAQFKNSRMKKSELSPSIIEAALTHIIENLDKYPKVIAALRGGKIGYHDKGAMLNDMGVRNFVIQGSATVDNKM